MTAGGVGQQPDKAPQRRKPAAATTLAAREAAVRAGMRALAVREQQATLREQALLQREQAVRTQAEFGALAAAQLREANERLVLASVHAQATAEAAEGAAEQMSHRATHDALTGLPNRDLLTDRLAQALTLAQRRGKRVALMYLDLDHFKQINDSLGHAVGDELLQMAARRLQEHVRQSDTVCRQGGDEFVVLLSEIEAVGDAARTAEKLIAALAEAYAIGTHRITLTLSLGISLYPDHGKDVQTIVSNADTAMYYAKARGRNNFQLFAAGMTVHTVV